MAIIYVPPNRPPYELYMQLGQMIMNNVKGNEQKAAMRVLQRNLSKLAPGQASPTPQQTQQGLDADLAKDKEAMRTAAIPNVDFAGTVANPDVVQNAAAQKLLEGYRQAATGAQQNQTLTSLIAPGQAAPVRQSSYPGLPGPSSKGDAMQYQIPSSLLPGGTFGGVPQYQKVSLTDMLGAIADPRVAALGPQAINSFMNTLLAATKQERDQGVADHAYGSAYTAKQAQAKQLMDYANSIPDPQMRAQLMTAAVGSFMGSPNESVAAAANTKMMEQRAAEEQYIRELIGRMNDQTNREQINVTRGHYLRSDANQAEYNRMNDQTNREQINVTRDHYLRSDTNQAEYNKILAGQKGEGAPLSTNDLLRLKDSVRTNYTKAYQWYMQSPQGMKDSTHPDILARNASKYAREQVATLGYPKSVLDGMFPQAQAADVSSVATKLRSTYGNDGITAKATLDAAVRDGELSPAEAEAIWMQYGRGQSGAVLRNGTTVK